MYYEPGLSLYKGTAYLLLCLFRIDANWKRINARVGDLNSTVYFLQFDC